MLRPSCRRRSSPVACSFWGRKNVFTQSGRKADVQRCSGKLVPTRYRGKPDPTRRHGMGNGIRVESLQPSAVLTYTCVSRKRRGQASCPAGAIVKTEGENNRETAGAISVT